MPAKITMEMIQAMNAGKTEKAEKAVEKITKSADEKPQTVEKPQPTEKIENKTIEKQTSPQLSAAPMQIPALKPITTLAATKRSDFTAPPTPVKQPSPAVQKQTGETLRYYHSPAKNETEIMKPPQISPIKPKKLPLLLPKKPESLMALGNDKNSEISVTRINDGNANRKVYGPKTNSNPNPTPTSDGFLFPLPPKSISNNAPSLFPLKPTVKQTPPMFMPGYNVNNNKAFKSPSPGSLTPFPRTPFYSPDSPVYTPGSYDSKPQYKYTNPLQYTSFLNNMISNLSKSQASPIQDKPTTSNPRKHKSPSPETTITKRKTPDNVANNTNNKLEKEPAPPMSVLKNISFPPSLSVSFITNEQEQEQIRNLKQNVVNNNIEIIKLPDSDEKRSSPKSASPTLKNPVDNKKVQNSAEESKPKSTSPEINLPPPVQAVLADPKESFQKKFLESIISNANKSTKVQNRMKRPANDTVEKRQSPSTSPTNVAKKSMPPPALPNASPPPALTMNNMNFPELAWMAMNNMNLNMYNNPFTLQRQLLFEQLKKNVERQNLLQIHMKNNNSPNPKK
jgi:hypothetical protein